MKMTLWICWTRGCKKVLSTKLWFEAVSTARQCINIDGRAVTRRKRRRPGQKHEKHEQAWNLYDTEYWRTVWPCQDSNLLIRRQLATPETSKPDLVVNCDVRAPIRNERAQIRTRPSRRRFVYDRVRNGSWPVATASVLGLLEDKPRPSPPRPASYYMISSQSCSQVARNTS